MPSHSMDNPDRIRLLHMLEAAREAVSFADGESLDSLKSDRKLALALIKDIEIIGEAASKISKDMQNHASDVPWAIIIAMRNRLIHGYFDIDFEQVWNTITDDLPMLIAQLEKLTQD